MDNGYCILLLLQYGAHLYYVHPSFDYSKRVALPWTHSQSIRYSSKYFLYARTKTSFELALTPFAGAQWQQESNLDRREFAQSAPPPVSVFGAWGSLVVDGWFSRRCARINPLRLRGSKEQAASNRRSVQTMLPAKYVTSYSL